MNRQIIVKDILISYSEIKGGNGRTFVFLHGWRSNKDIWRGVSGRLSIVNCQLFALDLPGFGGSQAPQQPMTVGDYAEVAAEFIKKLELKSVIIVGHSFGGRVGIKLASKYPEFIGKLVLVDSAGFAMAAGKKKLLSAAAGVVSPFFKLKITQGLKKKIYQKIGAEDYLATPELQKTFVNVIGEDLSEDMKKIKVPTLVISGENDKDTPVHFGELMRALIPGSKFIVLKNAGHFSFLDKPEEFVKELYAFVAVGS